MAMMGMAAMLTGCGDDDDGDDDDNGGTTNPPSLFAPATIEGVTAQNRTYTANVAGQEPITLTFPSAGNYQIVQGGATETGAIGNATRTENTWTMDLTPTAGQDGATNAVLSLTWTADNAGTFTYTPAGGTAESGNFTVTTGGGADNGGDNGGDTGGGWPTSNDLSGRTLQFSYAGGGGDRFDFTSGTDARWEPASDNLPATYTFNPATGVVEINVPARGETFNATLPPQNTTGTTTVNITANGGTQALENSNYTLSNPQ